MSSMGTNPEDLGMRTEFRGGRKELARAATEPGGRVPLSDRGCTL